MERQVKDIIAMGARDNCELKLFDVKLNNIEIAIDSVKASVYEIVAGTLEIKRNVIENESNN